MSQSGTYSVGGGGVGDIQTLTGNVGGAVGPDGASNINVVGAGGVVVTGNPGTNTLTITAEFAWNEVVAGAQALANNEGYVANNGAGVVFTLPVAAAIGDSIKITGKNAGGFAIHQNAGQTIYFGVGATTTGVAGTLSSTATRDSLELVCVTPSTDWNVVSAVGNFAIV